MKCLLLNFYLLLCIGVHATTFTVHSISIDKIGADAVLMSGMCLLWLIGCMVSMVVVTRTYMMTYTNQASSQVKVKQFKSNNRLYSSLLALNTIFTGIALASFLFH